MYTNYYPVPFNSIATNNLNNISIKEQPVSEKDKKSFSQNITSVLNHPAIYNHNLSVPIPPRSITAAAQESSSGFICSALRTLFYCSNYQKLFVNDSVENYIDPAFLHEDQSTTNKNRHLNQLQVYSETALKPTQTMEEPKPLDEIRKICNKLRLKIAPSSADTVSPEEDIYQLMYLVLKSLPEEKISEKDCSEIKKEIQEIIQTICSQKNSIRDKNCVITALGEIVTRINQFQTQKQGPELQKNPL